MSIPAFALNVLQLDIAGGTYDLATQTTVSGGPSFTLYAMQTPGNGNKATFDSGSYFLSAAVRPKETSSSADYGSFKIGIDMNANGVIDGAEPEWTVPVVGGMVYGVPPIETLAGGIATDDQGDLQDHGIFKTYFKEFQFNFDIGLQATAYNAETGGKTTLVDTDSGGMYFMPFLVDLGGLNADKSIHFDLYSSELAKNSTTDLDIDLFAPFSHDAEGGGGRVPDGGATAALLGLGMLGLGLLARRKA